MPIYKIELTGLQSGWGIWRVTETEAELAGDETCPGDITNGVKRMEWNAGRQLLRELTKAAGLRYRGSWKDDFGKPYLTGLTNPITLSHSFPFVAAQISQSVPVGIDIEQPKEKLVRVAPRVFTPDELHDAGDGIVKNCIYWCAKEALYKIYGQRGLSFKDHLHIAPFVAETAGDLTGTISVDGVNQEYMLCYEVTPDFVLVRTS